MDPQDYLISRFERQLVLKGWSMKKQLLLADTTLTLPSELYLAAIYGAAAGVGRFCFTTPLPSSSPLKAQLKALSSTTQIFEQQPSPQSAFSAVLSAGDPNPTLLENHPLILGYHVKSHTVILSSFSKSGPPRSIEQPTPHFVSSHHVVSLLAISILINEVGNHG